MRVEDVGGTVAMTEGDTTLFRYRTDTEASKPHSDVLALPPAGDGLDGRNLVLAAPHDHAWHLGLFFCQKLVDGLNCWESEHQAARDEPHGYAESGPYEVTRGGDAATVTHEVTWVSDAGERLLADERTVRIGDVTDAGYFLTWEQTFEALESTRHLSSETIHGHYSGLSIRFRRSLDGGTVRLPGVENPDDGTGSTGRWCDYSGNLDGQYGTDAPPEAGVTVFSPVETTWFTRTEPYGLVTANPTWQTVHTVSQGESLTWYWGLWVHRDAPDPEAVETARDRYRTWADVSSS